MKKDVRRGGWLSTLFALVLLIVTGFLFGAMAGFLWEEPRLVFAYLSGESEPVDWSERPEPRGDLPAVAAGPSNAPPSVTPVKTAKAERPPAAKPVSAPKPAARKTPPRQDPPAVSARAPEGFAVQVGSFEESAAADRLAVSLRERGYSTYVKTDPASAGRRWRVRVGPVAERDEAQRLASRLERKEKLPTWVLEETGD